MPIAEPWFRIADAPESGNGIHRGDNAKVLGWWRDAWPKNGRGQPCKSSPHQVPTAGSLTDVSAHTYADPENTTLMYRVALIFAVLAAAGSLALSFTVTKPKITELTDANNTLTENLTASEAAKGEAEKKAKAATAAAEKSASELVTTKKELEETTAEADQQRKRADKYFADLNKATTEKNSAQEQLARWSALRIQPDQVIALQQDLKVTKETAAALADQEKILTRNIANLKSKLSKYEDENVLVEMPGLKGKIVEVDPKWDFVILDVGSTQGAKEGGLMLVRRGDKLVGKVRIVSVENSRSVANVISDWKQGNVAVAAGDAVLY